MNKNYNRKENIMFKEALEFLVSQKKIDPRVGTIFEDEQIKKVLITKPDCTSEILEFQKEPNVNFAHVMNTLESFLGFLVEREESNGIVFLESYGLQADLDYQGYYKQKIFLDFTHASSFKSLQNMASGIDLKSLWKLLSVEMSDFIDPGLELLTILRSVEIKNKDQTRVEIDRLGNVSNSRSLGYTINFPDAKGEGNHTAEIPIDYKYNGPIWDFWPRWFEFDLKLFLSVNEGGLKFEFFMKNEQQKMHEIRLALLEEIRDALSDTSFEVYDGLYKTL